jgi:hypothetical protein
VLGKEKKLGTSPAVGARLTFEVARRGGMKTWHEKQSLAASADQPGSRKGKKCTPSVSE